MGKMERLYMYSQGFLLLCILNMHEMHNVPFALVIVPKMIHIFDDKIKMKVKYFLMAV